MFEMLHKKKNVWKKKIWKRKKIVKFMHKIISQHSRESWRNDKVD